MSRGSRNSRQMMIGRQTRYHGTSSFVTLLVSLLLVVSTELVNAKKHKSNNNDSNNANDYDYEIDGNYKPNSWYKRYDSYPPYCSIPNEMETRKIPPLSKDDPHLGETRLVHVTSIIRHGARTPWTSDAQCWEDYWKPSHDTSTWDCDLTTILAPPSPNRIEQEEGSHRLFDSNAMFLFEKKYDALEGDNNNNVNDDNHYRFGTNELHGTCQVGQLILQGYEQEILNGKFIRDAYLYDSTNFDHDERMRLLDTSFTKYSPWDKQHLLYRADDEQRTLMSGQVLLRGIFGPEVLQYFKKIDVYPIIEVHTADFTQDIVAPKDDICYNKWYIESRLVAEQSTEYQKYNSSEQAIAIRKFMNEKLGMNTTEEIVDCLMTTICTDRKLPDPINDYNNTKRSTNWFQTLSNFQIEGNTIIYKHNDSDYSKQKMGPLWYEIMNNINPIINQEETSNYNNDEEDENPISPKLAIFSGHDSTLIPMLASLSPSLLNDTHHPPYASMMIIELHEIIDGRTDRTVYKTPFAFRLVYNGQVLTSYVDGCPKNSDLCDVRFLKERVDTFAKYPTNCMTKDEYIETQTSPTPVTKQVIHDTATLLSTLSGIILFIGVIVISMLLGSISMFVWLTGSFPTCSTLSSMSTGRKVIRSNYHDDDDDSNDGLGQIALTQFHDNKDDDNEIVFSNSPTNNDDHNMNGHTNTSNFDDIFEDEEVTRTNLNFRRTNP